jgi:SAM-dependent methyltransferase
VIELGRVFDDAEVAALYRYRAPYPREVFEILEQLVVEPRTVLDAGAGTGALARDLAPLVTRVDAVDPSGAMIAAGRALPGGDDPRITWIQGRAEDAPLSPPYGLIVAGASLHWMDPTVVLPRFREALAPGAQVAIVHNDFVPPHAMATGPALDVIRRYSPLKDDPPEYPARVKSLVDRGLFVLEGERRTTPVPFEQSIDDVLNSLHSTSTLSRVTLGDRLASFDNDMRAALAPFGKGPLRSDIVAYIAWGRPS